MKVLHIFLLFFVIGVYAQRRVTRPEQPEQEVSSQRTVRGRSRFTTEASASEVENVRKPVNSRRAGIRSRQENARTAERRPSPRAGDDISKQPYEVEEVIDDIPNDNQRYTTRSRVITETKFEAKAAPKTQLFQPSSTTPFPSTEELLNNFGRIASDTEKTLSDEDEGKAVTNEVQSTEILDKKQETSSLAPGEIFKVEGEQLKHTTAKASASTKSIINEERQQLRARESSEVRQDLRRTNVRSRSRSSVSKVDGPTTQASRIRTRGPRRQEIKEETTRSAPQSTRNRPSRRQLTTSRSRAAPSVFASESEQVTTRTRTGRKVSAKDNDFIDLNNVNNVNTELRGGRGQLHERVTTTTAGTIDVLHLTERNVRRRGSSRFQAPEATTESIGINEAAVPGKGGRQRSRQSQANPEIKSRNEVRSRSRFSPPGIDEAKLEVLPLFEVEPHAVNLITDKPILSTTITKLETEEKPDLSSTTSTTTTTLRTTSTAATTAKAPRRKSQRARKHETVTQSHESEAVTRRSSRRTAARTATTSKTKILRTSTTSTTQTPEDSKPTAEPTTKLTTERNTRRRQVKTETTLKPRQIERRQTKPIEARTLSTLEQKTATLIKETVKVSEREVVSTKKIGRRKLNDNRVGQKEVVVKIEQPKVTITEVIRRGTKKGNLHENKKGKPGLSSSEEDIDEGDNYPEPFKTLIQEKKAKTTIAGSRPRGSLVEAPVTKSSVKAASTTTTTASSTAQDASSTTERATTKVEEFDNELLPKATTVKPRPTRKRFSLTTKQPTINAEKTAEKSLRFERSTIRPSFRNKKDKTVVTEVVTEKSSSSTIVHKQKYHARFNSGGQRNANAPPKPPRGLYSSRKNLKANKIDNERNNVVKSAKKLGSASTTQASTLSSNGKKVNRFSARYRSDLSSRGPTTGLPVYVPTIPTVTPSPAVRPRVQLEDNSDLGVHIISFDDTVNNTIQSDNLISGEISPSTNPSTVVSGGGVSISATSTQTADKQMSIIERIINSITSISTTPSPDQLTKTTTTQVEPTKGSAILKLATKKSTSPELTVQRLTLTTEKPTTIIERILTSLSAIQAETTTESRPKSTQVGSNFNSISTTFKPPSTKRSVTKELPFSSSTLPAHVTSTLDPLTVLEQIAADQTQQKRTIGKLLAILNTVNNVPTTPKLVIVTPKITSFVTAAQPQIIGSMSSAQTISASSQNTTAISPQTNPATISTATPVLPITTPKIAETTTEKMSTAAPPQTSTTTTNTPTIASSSSMLTTLNTESPTEAPTTSTSTSTPFTSPNPKNEVETFVPTTIPVVSTRVQDMLNLLSRLMGNTNLPSTTTTSTETTTVNSVDLSARIGESNTNPPPAATTTDAITPLPTTPQIASEVNDLTSMITSTAVPLTAPVEMATDAPTTTMSIASRLSDSAKIDSTTTETSMPETISTLSATQNPPTTTNSAVPSNTNEKALTTKSSSTETMSTDSLISKPMTTTNPTIMPALPTSTNAATSNTITNTNPPTESANIISPNSQKEATVKPGAMQISTRYTATPVVTELSSSGNIVSKTTSRPVTVKTTVQYTSTPIFTEFTRLDVVEESTTSVPEMTLDTTLNPSTLPTLQKFEVSPDSVSVFSANDLSATLSDDSFGTTVSIFSRNNFVTTTGPEEVQVTAIASNENATSESTTVESATSSATTNVTTDSMTSNDTMSTESVVVTTTVGPLTSSESTVEDIASNVIDNTKPDQPNTSLNMSSIMTLNASEINPNVTTVSRSGRLLNIAQEPVENDIQSSPVPRARDYFIFAVLPNNTILRKRPSMFPTKETPFLIVGYYPNNTIIRKFPNGTLVPEEPIMQVSGFDTRDPLPPLPDITSNQVTQIQGDQPDNNVLQTAEKIQLATNELPLSTSTTISTTTTMQPTATLPTLSELLGGKTVQAFNTIVEQTNGENSSVKFETLEIDPLTHKVQADKFPVSNNVVFRWKPVKKSKMPVVLLQTSTGSSVELININENIITGSASPKTEKPTEGIETLARLAQAPTTTVAAKTSTTEGTTETTTTAVKVTNKPSTSIPTTSTTNVPTITTEAATTQVPQTTTAKPVPVALRIAVETTEPSTPVPTTSVPTTMVPTTFAPTTFKATTLRTTQGFSTTYLPTFLTTLLSTLQPRFRGTRPPTTMRTTIPTTQITTTETPIEPTTTQQTTTTKAVTRRATAARRTRGTTIVPTTTTRESFTVPLSTITMPTTPRRTTIPNVASFATTMLANLRSRIRLDNTTPVQTTITTEVPTTTPYIVTATSVTRGRPSAALVQSTPAKPVTKRKELTEEQRQNLETLAQLEKEQAAILKQLSFLTNLNFGGPKPSNPQNNLANRIIALAVERNKENPTTTSNPIPAFNLLEALSPSNSRQSKKLVTTSGKQPSIEEILQQLNGNSLNTVTPSSVTTTFGKSTDEVLAALLQEQRLISSNSVTPSSVTATYGKSTDAILAALLKEQGLGPTTPESLGEQLRPLISSTTTPRPRTTQRIRTTPAPGRLRQGLNWLLTALAPPPAPKARPRPRPTAAKPDQYELLAHEPTNITPVFDNTLSVTTINPDKQAAVRSINSLSDTEFQTLLKQLEAAQKDPSKLNHIDLSFLKAAQNHKNVEISNSGSSGRSSKLLATTTLAHQQFDTTVFANRGPTTAIPLSSNSIAAEEITLRTSKVSLPPVKLSPVPGLPEEDTQVRGQLVSAAVNVTKAISQFFGSAIQGAAQSFQSLIGSGSRQAGKYLGSGSGSLSSG